MELEPGFYWVKWKRRYSSTPYNEWVVSEWTGDFWFKVGLQHHRREPPAIIGPRITPPEE